MFFRKKMSPGCDWLIVGLGNPGREYENTRHNVGFLVIDELADRTNTPVSRLKYRALTGTATIGGQKVLFMKPTTYMNLSGQSVSEASKFFKLPPEKILIIVDDVDLPVGKLRLRRKGSAGGHNGLKSLIACLGTDEFPRVKLGVGQKPHPDYDMADWVLGKFTSGDAPLIRDAVSAAADAVELILKTDMDKAMSRYN